MKMFGKKGFTLVELLIVVLILAALAAIAVPRIGASAANARIRACEANVSTINSQLELFWANTGARATAIGDVTGDTNYFPDNAPTCPLTGTYSLQANGHVACSH